MKLLLSLIFTTVVYSILGQNIHHQMMSAQGKSSVTSSGLIVHHTVGQLSVTGNFKGNFSIQQGYQQSLWSTYLSSSEKIILTTSPNPFTESVHFNLNSIHIRTITIQIFDTNGKQVYQKEQLITNNLFTLQLSELSLGTYLVKLKGAQFQYYTKIIKI
jgi:amino acid permease